MEMQVKLKVPKLIYDIYLSAAEQLDGYTVEQVMSSALHAYAQCLYEEMVADGELPVNTPQ